jgi:lipopolysaccharide transport system ATP-binding protein
MFLERGRLVEIGETADVIKEYLALASATASQNLAERTDRQGDGRLRFTGFSVRSGENGQYSEMAQCGQDIEFVASFTNNGNLRDVNASMAVYAPSGQCLIVLDTEMAGVSLDSVPRSGQFSCRIERLPLTPGQYSLNLYCTASGAIVDWVQNAATFTVEAGDFFGTGKLPSSAHGGLLVPQAWSCDASDRDGLLPNDAASG